MEVVDFGIRGFDLFYALLDGYDITILVDATPRGGLPGTLYKIEPDLKEIENLDCEAMAVETHGMNPLKVFSMVKSLGGEFRRLILVGCEPADLGELEEGRLGLTDAVRASVDGAVTMVEKLVQEAIEESAANCAIESRE